MKSTTKQSIAGILMTLVSLFCLAMPVEARNSRTAWASIDGVTENSFLISYGYDWQGANAYRLIIKNTTLNVECTLEGYFGYEYFEEGSTDNGVLNIVALDLGGSFCHDPNNGWEYNFTGWNYTFQFDVWQVGKNGRVRLLAQVLAYWDGST